MPIVSDPQLFLEIFENRPDPNKAGGRVPPNRRLNNYAKRFQSHCWAGDQRLGAHLRRVLSEQFGRDNRQLVTTLYDHFKSNANWRELGIIYRMDRYSSCRPDLTDGPQPSRFKKGDKLWADLWEAEWEVICQEREMFNDSMDGIDSILQWLIAFRYRLLNLFRTNKILEMPTIPGLSRDVSAGQVTVTKVDAGNTSIQKCMVNIDKSFPPFGYLATISVQQRRSSQTSVASPSKNTSNRTVTTYASTEDRARSRVLYLARTGSKGIYANVQSLTFMLDRQKNLLDVIYSKRTDENVLQGIFDTMSHRWLGQYTPLSSDVIRPVYDHIQRVLCQIDSIQRRRFDAPDTLQARLSWYEVPQV